MGFPVFSGVIMFYLFIYFFFGGGGALFKLPHIRPNASSTVTRYISRSHNLTLINFIIIIYYYYYLYYYYYYYLYYFYYYYLLLLLLLLLSIRAKKDRQKDFFLANRTPSTFISYGCFHVLFCLLYLEHRGINDTEIFVVNTASLPKTKIKKSVQKICS